MFSTTFMHVVQILPELIILGLIGALIGSTPGLTYRQRKKVLKQREKNEHEYEREQAALLQWQMELEQKSSDLRKREKSLTTSANKPII